MSFISDLLINVSAFRITIGNKINALKTLIDGKQNTLSNGLHTTLNGNKIDVAFDVNTYVKDKSNNDRLLFGNTMSTDVVIKGAVANGDFKVKDSADADLFRMNGSNKVLYFPQLPAPQTGASNSLAIFDSGNGLWKHNIKISDLITTSNIGTYIPAAQNLSLGITTGSINISGGTGVNLSSIDSSNRPDANSNTFTGKGLQAFFNSTGSVNYPGFGGGISYIRSVGSFAGAFDIFASNTNDNKLYYRRGSSSTAYNNYEIFASESWSSDNFHKLAKTNTEATTAGYYAQVISQEVNNVLGNVSFYLNSGTIGGTSVTNGHIVSFGTNANYGFQLYQSGSGTLQPLRVRNRTNGTWTDEEIAYRSWVTQQITNAGSNYIPYTGANQAVNLNTQSFTTSGNITGTNHTANRNNLTSVSGYRFTTNNSLRMFMYLGAENGSNGGGGLVIQRYDDSGASLGTALLINRQTGLLTAYAGYAINGRTNSDIVLAGGGHRPVSDFALASSLGNYVAKSGDTMTGALTIKSSTNIGKDVLLTLGRYSAGYGDTKFSQSYDNRYYSNGKTLDIDLHNNTYLSLAGANNTANGKIIAHKPIEYNGITSDNWNTAFGWGDFRDFGLGLSTNSNYIVNADTHNPTSFGVTASSFVGSPFAGVSGHNQGYLNTLSWGSGNYKFQEHIPINSNIARRYRIKNNGVWGAWVTGIDSNNLDTQATSLGFIKSSALPTVNDGQLTLTTGTGLSGSANFTANQSGNSSFDVEIASTHKLPTITEWNALPTANTITRLRGTTSGTFTSGDLTLLAGSNVSILQSGSDFTINAKDTDTTYTAGTGLTLTGTVFGQAITTSGSGTYVQSITQTASGFQVNLGTPPNTTYTGSNGINVTGTVISPTYGTTANTIAQGNDARINNGQTAFGWGNHATAGYTNTTIGANGSNYTSGAISINQGAGIAVTKSGNTISISTTGSGGGGITSLETDDPNLPGPTSSNRPIVFNSHVAYGKPETAINDEEVGNGQIWVESGDVVRFHHSFDNVRTFVEPAGTIVDIDTGELRKHIINVVFMPSSGADGTVYFGAGVYTGDQINITVPRGQAINLQPQRFINLISSAGQEVYTHANLIWDAKIDSWVLVGYD